MGSLWLIIQIVSAGNISFHSSSWCKVGILKENAYSPFTCPREQVTTKDCPQYELKSINDHVVDYKAFLM